MAFAMRVSHDSSRSRRAFTETVRTVFTCLIPSSERYVNTIDRGYVPGDAVVRVLLSSPAY